MESFALAPWPHILKILSFFGSAILVGAGVAAAYAFPHDTRVPYAETLRIAVAFGLNSPVTDLPKSPCQETHNDYSRIHRQPRA